MARTVRTRTRPVSFIGTKTTSFDGGQPSTVVVSINKTCSITDSWHRPIVPSPLTSTQWRGDLMANGSVTSSQSYDTLHWKFKFINYPLSAPTTLNVTPLTAPAGWTLDLVAGTNPSRPVLMPPTLLQDIYELPKQIFESGKLLKKAKKDYTSKDAANAHLLTQFGWLPLIEDLQKLLKLQEYILKRNKELQQLYSGKGLRRRLKFSDDSQTEAGKDTLAMYGLSNYVTLGYTVTVKRRTWGTIHWRPTAPPLYHPLDYRNHNYVRNIVLGLTPEGIAKGLWDVIPWTWLIGWFTNIGKYLLAHSNTVPAAWSEACFMSEVVVNTVAGRADGSGISDLKIEISGVRQMTTKTRQVSSSITPGFNVPYLDTWRLSILSALFVQRLQR